MRLYIASSPMHATPLTPEALLQQMAAIQSMEQGKLCVLREGPNGPYYNLQHREQGANVTRYIPAEQVRLVQANLAAYAQFQELLGMYVHLLSTRSREE